MSRIEVLRASNSVVHGSQAIGGVVSLTTATPADGFAAGASADYGSVSYTHLDVYKRQLLMEVNERCEEKGRDSSSPPYTDSSIGPYRLPLYLFRDETS